MQAMACQPHFAGWSALTRDLDRGAAPPGAHHAETQIQGVGQREGNDQAASPGVGQAALMRVSMAALT